MLEVYAKVGRIYLTPEDSSKYASRVKTGGCKKESFVEGWVEFLSKVDAKQIALALNGKSIGGKKRHNFYHDDVWCMKYLSKFTWNDLVEHRVYQKQMNSKKLQTMLSKQKRDDEYFLESVEKKNRMDTAERKRAAATDVETTPAKRVKSERTLPRQKTAFVFKPDKPELPSLLLAALAK